MNIIGFFSAHPVECLIGLYIYSTVVSAMPEPYPESRWYAMVYKILHVTAASAGRFYAARAPIGAPALSIPSDSVVVQETKTVAIPPSTATYSTTNVVAMEPTASGVNKSDSSNLKGAS